MKKRSYIEISADILRACRKWPNITRIIYATGMNTRQARYYLSKLVELEYLKVNSRREYYLTNEGDDFLTKYDILTEKLRKGFLNESIFQSNSPLDVVKHSSLPKVVPPSPPKWEY